MAAVPDQFLGKQNAQDVDPGETQEWLQALDGVIRTEGAERAAYLIDQQSGVSLACISNYRIQSPYLLRPSSP